MPSIVDCRSAGAVRSGSTSRCRGVAVSDRSPQFPAPSRRFPHRGGARHPAAPPELSMDPRAAAAAASPDQSVIRSAIYRDGQRVDSPAGLAETYQQLREQPDTMAWIGLYRPAETQLLTVAEEFGLHELAVDYAIVAHQLPKLEHNGNTPIVVLRASRYRDDTEEVDYSEIHVFVGRNFVLTVRHGQAGELAAVRHRLEDEPDLLRRGPEAVLYAILDAVVDGYAPVVAGLQHDIEIGRAS